MLIEEENPERRKAIGKQISPASHVGKEFPRPRLSSTATPTNSVPIQQAELIGAKYKEAECRSSWW